MVSVVYDDFAAMNSALSALRNMIILCPVCGMIKPVDSFVDPLFHVFTSSCKECRTEKEKGIAKKGYDLQGGRNCGIAPDAIQFGEEIKDPGLPRSSPILMENSQTTI